MAIELGESTAQIKTDEVTWNFQCKIYEMNGDRIQDPLVEVFRAVVKKINGGEQVLFSPSQAPLSLRSSKLPELIPHLKPAASLQEKFTSEELEKIVTNLPDLLTMSFDAVARKVRADEEARIAAAQAQADLAAQFAQVEAS